MNKRLFLVLPLLLLGFGCTTASFAGLARSEYVDQVSVAGQATQSELDELELKVAQMQELADQLESIIAAMEETRKATEELQELADIVETRLESLPRETLSLLVESIQAFLDQ